MKVIRRTAEVKGASVLCVLRRREGAMPLMKVPDKQDKQPDIYRRKGRPPGCPKLGCRVNDLHTHVFLRREGDYVRYFVWHEGEDGRKLVPYPEILKRQGKLRSTPEYATYWVPDELVEQLQDQEKRFHNQQVMKDPRDPVGSYHYACKSEMDGFHILSRIRGELLDKQGRQGEDYKSCNKSFFRARNSYQEGTTFPRLDKVHEGPCPLVPTEDGRDKERICECELVDEPCPGFHEWRKTVDGLCMMGVLLPVPEAPYVPKMSNIQAFHWRKSRDRDREKEEAEGYELSNHIAYLQNVNPYGMENFFVEVDELPDRDEDLYWYGSDVAWYNQVAERLNQFDTIMSVFVTKLMVEKVPVPEDAPVVVTRWRRLPIIMSLRQEYYRWQCENTPVVVRGTGTCMTWTRVSQEDQPRGWKRPLRSSNERVVKPTDHGFLSWLGVFYPRVVTHGVKDLLLVGCDTQAPSQELEYDVAGYGSRVVGATSMYLKLNRTRRHAPKVDLKPGVYIPLAVSINPETGKRTEWRQAFHKDDVLAKPRLEMWGYRDKPIESWKYWRFMDTIVEFMRRRVWYSQRVRRVRATQVIPCNCREEPRCGEPHVTGNGFAYTRDTVRSLDEWPNQYVDLVYNQRLTAKVRKLARLTAKLIPAHARFISRHVYPGYEAPEPLIRPAYDLVSPDHDMIKEIRTLQPKAGWPFSRPTEVQVPLIKKGRGNVPDPDWSQLELRTWAGGGGPKQGQYDFKPYACWWCYNNDYEQVPFVRDVAPWKRFQESEFANSPQKGLFGSRGTWRCMRCGVTAKSDAVRLLFTFKISGGSDAATWEVTADIFGDAFLKQLWAAWPGLYQEFQVAEVLRSLVRKYKRLL